MNFLITAGPTIEPLDDVRFISNFSSGKTGIAIAKSARDSRHNVRIILGSTSQPCPSNIEAISIQTANELLCAIEDNFEWADCLIMAAAVCDYRPKQIVRGKIKGKDSPLTLELVPNPDILAHFGRKKASKIIVGFALESENGIASALAKCRSKNCDMICLNSPTSLNGSETEITIIFPDGSTKPFPSLPKEIAAKTLIKEILLLATNRVAH